MAATNCPICQRPLLQRFPSVVRKYCSRACCWKAKKRPIASRLCQVCEKNWTPNTKEQNLRNKTCSKACANVLTGQSNRGCRKERPFCLMCGIRFDPAGRCAIADAKYCSSTCAAQARKLQPGYYEKQRAAGAKGKSGWTEAGRARYRQKMSGPNNHAWKGGVTHKRNKGNYIGAKFVRCPVEFCEMAGKNGYLAEHRLVVARHLSRCLERHEVVHHRDHITRNNAIENLELWPNNRSHKMAEGGRFEDGVSNPFFGARLEHAAKEMS